MAAKANQANLSVPAYVRNLCKLQPWTSRRHVVEERCCGSQPMALDRMSVTIWVTEQEWADLREQARASEGLMAGGDSVLGLGLPQFLRTLCGFRVRWTSKPNTYERDVEENDAIELLHRLGLDTKDYFPEGYFG